MSKHSHLAVLTAFLATLGVTELRADSLTIGTFDTVRLSQAQSITVVSLDVRQNRGGFGGPETILLQSSNAVNFSGMSVSNVVVELQRRTFEAALSTFTNNTDPTAEFSVFLVGRSTSSGGFYHEVATVYPGYRLAPNGSGGWTFSDPTNDTQEKLLVNFAKHLVVPKPLWFYSGTSTVFGFSVPLSNPNAAKINIEDSSGNTVQVISARSRAGSYKIYELTLGDTEFGIYPDSGRVAFPMFAITNGTLGKVNLQYADGGVVRTRVFLLSNGLWVVAPLLPTLSVSGGTTTANVLGQTNEVVILSTATTLTSNTIWTPVTNLVLSVAGMGSYEGTTVAGEARRFWRVRYYEPPSP